MTGAAAVPSFNGMMSRLERRIFFERLCVLRSRYGRRPAADRRAVISIADAVALAERLLAATEL
jgi:hypothetical protein